MELFAEPIPDLPGVPSALLDVLRAGMANDPAGRPTAEQLRDMLAAVPLGGPAMGTPVSGAPFSNGPWAFGAGAELPAEPPTSLRVPSSIEPSDDTTVPARRPRRLRWLFGDSGR